MLTLAVNTAETFISSAGVVNIQMLTWWWRQRKRCMLALAQCSLVLTVCKQTPLRDVNVTLYWQVLHVSVKSEFDCRVTGVTEAGSAGWAGSVGGVWWLAGLLVQPGLGAGGVADELFGLEPQVDLSLGVLQGVAAVDDVPDGTEEEHQGSLQYEQTWWKIHLKACLASVASLKSCCRLWKFISAKKEVKVIYKNWKKTSIL